MIKIEKIKLEKGQRMLRFGLGQNLGQNVQLFIRIDLWWYGFRLKFEREEESYNPYCSVCEGCGEDGCCSAVLCNPLHPDCKYGETYIEDLKTSHRILKLIEKKLDTNNVIFYTEYDSIVDKVFGLEDDEKIDIDEYPVIHVEEIKAIQNRLNQLNSVPIQHITVFEENKEVVISRVIRNEFKFLGLNNTDFILSGFYKKGYEKIEK